VGDSPHLLSSLYKDELNLNSLFNMILKLILKKFIRPIASFVIR